MSITLDRYKVLLSELHETVSLLKDLVIELNNPIEIDGEVRSSISGVANISEHSILSKVNCIEMECAILNKEIEKL